jgi:hypothetical protein
MLVQDPPKAWADLSARRKPSFRVALALAPTERSGDFEGNRLYETDAA